MKSKDKKLAQLEMENRKWSKLAHSYNPEELLMKVFHYTSKFKRGEKFTEEEKEDFKMAVEKWEEVKPYEMKRMEARQNLRNYYKKQEVEEKEAAEKKTTKRRKPVEEMTGAEKREFYEKAMKRAAEKKKRAAAEEKAKEELNKDEEKTE